MTTAGEAAQVVGQEAGQEAIEFGGGGRVDSAWGEVDQGCRGEGLGEVLGCRTQAGLGEGYGEARSGEELEFEGEQTLGQSGSRAEAGEEFAEEAVELGDGGLGFGGDFQEEGGVSGLPDVGEAGAQGAVGLGQHHFAEEVEVRTAPALKAEARLEPQIELAAEGRFGTARALGDGGQATVFGREPVDDETGVGEKAGAENHAAGRFQAHKTADSSRGTGGGGRR